MGGRSRPHNFIMKVCRTKCKKSTSSGTYKSKLTEKSEIVKVDDVYYGLKKKAFRNQMVDKFLYYVMESEFYEKINM